MQGQRVGARASLPKVFRVLTNKNMLVTLLLGFSSGLPLALTGATLQAWYTTAGVSIVAIGSLSLVGQPYVYKFLWAPLLDRFAPNFLDRRRSWIIIMQLLLALGFVVMAFLHPKFNPLLLAGMALVVAFFSATQDIVIDAYRVDLLTSEERGLGSAMVAGGYRVAMLVSGGLALILAAEYGWRATYFLMAALMLISTLVTLFGPRVTNGKASSYNLKAIFWVPLSDFMQRNYAIWILVFIVLYKIGDAFALTLTTPFLIRGLGFSLIDVGAVYKVVGLVATMLGVFIGGMWMVRINLYRALLYFGLFQGVSTLSFVVLALVGKSFTVMIGAIFLEFFCGGLGTVALLAFFMALCNRKYSATHFALLTALSAIGRTFLGPLAGVIVEHVGWAQFYFWAVVGSCPGLILLFWLRNKIDFAALQASP